MSDEKIQAVQVTKYRLSDRVKKLLYYNTEIKKAIAESIGVDYWTVHRWIKNGDAKATQIHVLEAIRELTGLTDEVILEEKTA